LKNSQKIRDGTWSASVSGIPEPGVILNL